MAIRSFLINTLVVLFSLTAIMAGLYVLVTGVDLRSATGDEAWVAQSIPYLYILIGVLAASLPFWQRWVR